MERLFAPEDFTGFINPPSSQAQDHLLEAKRPGCCWWARLDQVMCGMDGCAGQQSPSVMTLMARTLRTVAVWDALPVTSRRWDAMTASGSRLASAAARSTCIVLCESLVKPPCGWPWIGEETNVMSCLTPISGTYVRGLYKAVC